MNANPSSSLYTGIYLRDHLDGTNVLPVAGPYGLCPDIIQSPSPIPKFQTVLSTPASYAESYTTQPVLGQPNYYYVRGKNGGSQQAADSVFLYAAPAQLISFPPTWQFTPILPAGPQAPTLTAAAGAVGVASSALVWPAPPPPAAGSDYYTMIARLDDSSNSNPIPTIATWEDMSALATNNLGFGFSNVSYVDPGQTTWVRRQMLTIPIGMPGPAELMLTLSGTGFAGATVGFIADTFNSDKTPIVLDPVTIPNGPFVTGITITVEPGFSTSLAVQCWFEDGASAAPGSTLTLAADYQVPEGAAEAALASGLINPRRSSLLRSIARSEIGPTVSLFVGSCTFVVDADTDD